MNENENLSQPPAETTAPEINKFNSETGDPASGIASPETNFLRGLMSRVSRFLRDPVKKLVGPDRLTAELLARTGKILAGKSEFDEIAEWQRKWDALQKIIVAHDDVTADAAWEKQNESLHEIVGDPSHQTGHIVDRDSYRKKYAQIRESARAQQRELFKRHIGTLRYIARQAADILHSHAIGLDAEQKNLFETYGLPYTGSPLVAAVKRAERTVIARLEQDGGEAAPDLLAPWLI